MIDIVQKDLGPGQGEASNMIISFPFSFSLPPSSQHTDFQA
jgi:hypothetical protein